jgi:uncharacterized protein YbcI
MTGRPQDLAHGALVDDLAAEMMRLYEKEFGLLAAKAECAFVGADALLCTLEGSFTPAEQGLAQTGQHYRIREVRQVFQYARQTQFREAVERITGREVRGFASGTDTHEDISCEVFYLRPGDGPGRPATVDAGS